MNAAALAPLYNALVEGASTADLVNVAAGRLGNPLNVCGFNLEVIAHSDSPGFQDHVWDLVTSSDERKHFEFDEATRVTGEEDKLLKSQKPLLLDIKNLEHRIIGHYIRWEQKILGHIMLFEHNRPFKNADFAYLTELGKILAYHLGRSGDVQVVRDPGAEMTLTALLNKKHIAPEIIARSLFPPDPACHYVLALVEAVSAKNDHKLPPSTLGLLSSKIPASRLTFYHDQVVMVIQDNKYREFDWEAYKTLFAKYDLRCGVSHTFYRLSDAHIAWQEARNALSNGVLFRPGAHIYRYFSLFHILDIVKQDNDPLRFMHEAVIKLRNYDRENNTRWFASMTVFVFSGCDIQRAAATLCVHKNTMRYRVSQIEEVLGRSFSDDRFVFELRLSVYIMYYLAPDAFYAKYGIPQSLVIFPEQL